MEMSIWCSQFVFPDSKRVYFVWMSESAAFSFLSIELLARCDCVPTLPCTQRIRKDLVNTQTSALRQNLLATDVEDL